MPASIAPVMGAGPVLAGNDPTSVTAIAARHARGELSSAESVVAVDPSDLQRILTPAADVSSLTAAVRGLGVSHGVAAGRLVFSAPAAVTARAAGWEPVLLLPESRPEDLPGLLASVAVVTERGGQTTHAAVVARALGRPAVAGLVDGVLVRDAAGTERLRTARGDILAAGDTVTVDGSTGMVYHGSPVEPLRAGPETIQMLTWLDTALTDLPAVAVRVNADSADSAAHGRALGATGVGLCRIEHMFLGERRALLERVLIARPGPELTEGLAEVHAVLRAELTELLR